MSSVPSSPSLGVDPAERAALGRRDVDGVSHSVSPRVSHMGEIDWRACSSEEVGGGTGTELSLADSAVVVIESNNGARAFA